eukprot:1786759-Prymnesium_polylepis.1
MHPVTNAEATAARMALASSRRGVTRGTTVCTAAIARSYSIEAVARVAQPGSAPVSSVADADARLRRARPCSERSAESRVGPAYGVVTRRPRGAGRPKQGLGRPLTTTVLLTVATNSCHKCPNNLISCYKCASDGAGNFTEDPKSQY